MKKGFTLIELLAVIVILAIIALIATPLIINVIDGAKKGAFKDSAYGLIKAGELGYTQDILDGTNEEVTFTYADGVETSSVSGKTLNYEGMRPQNGKISIDESGNIAIAIHNGTYCAKKFYSEEDVKIIDVSVSDCDYYTLGDNFTFDSSTGAITNYSNDGPKDVIIPEQINGVDVTSIEQYAFMSNDLTSVIIPDTVITIGKNAFAYNNLTNVEISSNATIIDEYAFYENQLSSVVIPSSVTDIGKFAFYKNQLENITMSSSVLNIGVAAFNVNQLPDNQAFIYKRNSDGSEDLTHIVSYGGSKRSDVVIPSSVTNIGEYALAYNDITSVTIPTSVTSIGPSSFLYNELTSVTIPSSVINIGDYAFYYSYLENLTISNGSTTIGDSAFKQNELTSVEIPNSVTSIGEYAFYDNYITSAIIDNSEPNVTIGLKAFSHNGVIQLETITPTFLR